MRYADFAAVTPELAAWCLIAAVAYVAAAVVVEAVGKLLEWVCPEDPR